MQKTRQLGDINFVALNRHPNTLVRETSHFYLKIL